MMPTPSGISCEMELTFLLLLGLGRFVLFVFRFALIAVFVDHSRRLAGGVAARFQTIGTGHLTVGGALGPGTLVVAAGCAEEW